MKLIKKTTNIPFMKTRFIFMLISACLIILSFYTWQKTANDKYSVDFLGGTELIVKFDKEIKTGSVRELLTKSGINGAIVQSFEGGENEFTIRVKGEDSGHIAAEVGAALRKVEENKIEIVKQDYVGPIIGEKIRKDAFISIALSLLIIGIYVTFRFEWRFAVGACIAILHDIIITSGLFVLFNGEVGAAFLAAILTVVGYSINDTIIIFDRVRENIRDSDSKQAGNKKQSNGKTLSQMSLTEIFDLSINQTLSRTILTSATTLFVIGALCKFGGGALSDLSWALLLGIFFGTYSSVFVASPAVLLFASESEKK